MNPEFRVSRRKLLQSSAFLATTSQLVGCDHGEGKEPTPLFIEGGPFPDARYNFSDAIKKYELQPTVIPTKFEGGDNVGIGLSYLHKIYGALSDLSQNDSLTVGDVQTISPSNFPIDIDPNDSVTSILYNFFKDTQLGQVTISFDGNSNVDYLLGTVSTPIFTTDSGWEMKSTILLNTKFPFGATASEENATQYNSYTDLQVALKIIHEYGHCLQGRELLKLAVSRNASILETFGNDSFHMSSLVDYEAMNALNIMNSNPSIDRTKVVNPVQFNEAQANQVAQLTLNAVISLNGGNRMPGTQDDPYPQDSKSLFRTFDRAIIHDKNIFDTKWLLLHQ